MHKLTLLVSLILNLYFPIASSVSKPVPPTRLISNFDRFANQTPPACTTIDHLITVQNGLTEHRYRWQAFNVYPDPAYDKDELNAINDALYTLQQVIPCVSFGMWPSNSSPTGDYVHIIKGSNNGCNSFIGKLGGRQNMNLQSPECMTTDTILHEMIHALGFHHEQCRSDRDDWVTINWQNIKPIWFFNFLKLQTADWDTFDVPYNPHSIMHYNGYDFSFNGQPTITAKNGELVGSKGVLQDTDIQRLQKMYNCSNS